MSTLDPETADIVIATIAPLPVPAPPHATLLTVAKHAAIPVAIGAGVAALAAALLALRAQSKRPRFTLFAESKSSFIGGIAKGALFGVARELWHRAITQTPEAGSSAA